MTDLTTWAPRELYAVAVDTRVTADERIEARDLLLAKAKKAKNSVAKLCNLLPAGIAKWEEALSLTLEAEAPTAPEATDPLDEAPVEKVEEKAAEKPEGTPKSSQRGLISAMVRKLLLETDETYPEIEKAVRAKYPHAKTSTRSIASVASDMRKAKLAVAQRRVPAASK